MCVAQREIVDDEAELIGIVHEELRMGAVNDDTNGRPLTGPEVDVRSYFPGLFSRSVCHGASGNDSYCAEWLRLSWSSARPLVMRRYRFSYRFPSAVLRNARPMNPRDDVSIVGTGHRGDVHDDRTGVEVEAVDERHAAVAGVGQLYRAAVVIRDGAYRGADRREPLRRLERQDERGRGDEGRARRSAWHYVGRPV